MRIRAPTAPASRSQDREARNAGALRRCRTPSPLRYWTEMAGPRAVHARTGKVLAEELEVPRTFMGRGVGLMFRRRLEPGRGMWINPCEGGSIHMLFMRFAIDAVFLDKKERVKKVYPKVPAWYGVVWFVWGARSVLELPAGSTAELGLQQGDQVLIG